MSRVRSVSAFGFTFKTIRDLLDLLNYRSQLSYLQIVSRHSSIESFVKKQLKIDDDLQATQKLKELIEQQGSKRDFLLVTDDKVILKIKELALTDFLFSSESEHKIKEILKLYRDSRSVDEIKRLLLE